MRTNSATQTAPDLPRNFSPGHCSLTTEVMPADTCPSPSCGTYFDHVTGCSVSHVLYKVAQRLLRVRTGNQPHCNTNANLPPSSPPTPPGPCHHNPTLTRVQMSPRQMVGGNNARGDGPTHIVIRRNAEPRDGDCQKVRLQVVPHRANLCRRARTGQRHRVVKGSLHLHCRVIMDINNTRAA